MSDPRPPSVTPTAPSGRAIMPALPPWVEPVALVGRRVRLEPLGPGHLPGLVEAGADPATWTWVHAPLTDEASMRAWVETALRARDHGTEVPFATVDAATGQVLGSTRFLSIAPAHRRLEIGWTWLTPRPTAAARTPRPST